MHNIWSFMSFLIALCYYEQCATTLEKHFQCERFSTLFLVIIYRCGRPFPKLLPSSFLPHASCLLKLGLVDFTKTLPSAFRFSQITYYKKYDGWNVRLLLYTYCTVVNCTWGRYASKCPAPAYSPTSFPTPSTANSTNPKSAEWLHHKSPISRICQQ